MSDRGREATLSDQDYIDLVKTTCELTGKPMAPTQVIYEKNDLPVTDQTLKNHLEELSEEGELEHIEVGPGFAWSVPTEGKADGQVDFGNLDWDEVDINTIPKKRLAEHSDYMTIGERGTSKAENVVEYALYLSVVGGIITFVDQNLYSIENSGVVDVGAIALVTGLVFLMFGLASVMLFVFIDKLAQTDVYNAAKETAKELIPIGISKADGSLTITWK